MPQLPTVLLAVDLASTFHAPDDHDHEHVRGRVHCLTVTDDANAVHVVGSLDEIADLLAEARRAVLGQAVRERLGR